MTESRVLLVAIPTSDWKTGNIEELVADALVAERRIRKGSNLENERSRYTLDCHHIEQLAFNYLGSGNLHSISLPSDYFDLLRRIANLAEKNVGIAAQTQRARAGASFYPPSTLSAHLSAFEELLKIVSLAHEQTFLERSQFFKLFDQENPAFGVIEIQQHYYPTESRLIVDNRPAIFEGSIPLSLLEENDESALSTPTSQEIAFQLEVQKALGSNKTVNFSNPTHITITENLNRYVFDPAFSDMRLRVVYGDGSEAEPIRLGCLKPIEAVSGQLEELPSLKAALVSMRHLEMDPMVDFAWFLNQQVSRPQSFAITDDFCYQKSLEQLDRIKKPVKMYLYQTGLQPVVVGFYRALTEWLADHESDRGCLCVSPQYFKQPTGYTAGRLWL